MKTDALLELGALALSQSLHQGQASVTQLMIATLDRINAVNPRVNAIVNLADRQILLNQAQQYDQELQQNNSRGWLHGIPLAIKDNTNVAGFPTTNGGSPLAQDNSGYYPIQTETVPHIQALIDAGAIVIGKTNIPESAVGCHSSNPLFGVTRNPYLLQCSAGGSSGGAAAAVAARLVCCADGTDMMGSLRNPAGWNHLLSLRPTATTSSSSDQQVLGYPISMPGPIARTVEDLTALYQTMYPQDKQQSTNNKTYRIAWLGDWNGAYPMEEGILRLCHQALDRFASSSSSVQVDDLAANPIYDSKELWDSWTTIRSLVIAQQVESDLKGRSLESLNLKKELVWEVERGKRLTESQIEQAQRIAKDYSSALEILFTKCDAIALPSAQMWPVPADMKSFPMEIEGKALDTYHRWMEVAVPVSLAGLPCVTVPAGPDDEMRCMGIQIAGKRNSDNDILALVKHWPVKDVPVPFSG